MFPQISFFGLDIQTYFLWISLTFSLCLFFLVHRARQLKLDVRFALDLYLILSFSGLIGARLFHVFYEEFNYYQEDWLKIFELWRGGFVFFGGFLSSLLCGYLFVKFKHKNTGQIFDLCAPVASLGYALGRWGCLWAGCCYGKSCDLPWAVAGRHPTPVYSSIWEFGVLLILIGSEQKLRRNSGQLFCLWLGLHSIGRFLTEFYRDDFRGPEFLFSISGWISLILSVFAWFFFFKLRSKR